MNKPDDNLQRRTTSEFLRDVLAAQDGDQISVDNLLRSLHARAFGVSLLVLAIPNFIPAPIGIGGIMGTLIAILGLEMLCGLERPLVPKWLRRKTMERQRVERFLDRCAPIMRWLERWCKPRLVPVMRRPWSLLSGLSLIILGVLLALPIPFTNYPFGALLVAYAFALIERDGVLLIGMWLIALALLVLSVVFSSVLIDAVEHLLHYLT